MAVDSRIHPQPDELSQRDNKEIVSFSTEMLADLDTPVSAYLKLRGDGTSPSFLLESAEGGERIARYSFVGAQPRRVFRVKDGRGQFDGESGAFPVKDPLVHLEQLVAAYRNVRPLKAPFEGGLIGYLAYEAARYFERLPLPDNDPLGLPDAAFMDVDSVLIFDHIGRKARIVAHATEDDSPNRAYSCAARRIEEIRERLISAPVRRESAATREERPGARAVSNMSALDYRHMIERAKEHILDGDILQVVLAQSLSFPLHGDPFDIYRQLRMVSPSPYMYFLDFVDHQIIGASPELLIQVKDGVVSSRPIAGTRRRGGSPEQDEELEVELLADEKERAEHLMLVDLARNDVGRVSVPGSVRVRNFMTVERFSHVMHIVSDVAGELHPDFSSYAALRAAFPAGTVSGAPKIRAMEIIAELEGRRRGAYAGAVGFVNTAGDMEMAITIRTGVVKDGSMHLGVGAGIVADSVPEREYAETMNKGRSLLEAADIAS